MKILVFGIFLALGNGQNVPNSNSVTNINNIANVGPGGVNANNINNDVNNVNNNNRNINLATQNMNIPNNNMNPNSNNNQNNNNNQINNNTPNNNNVNNGGSNMGDQPFLPEYPSGSDRIYRPCPNMDINCIRKYFEKYGKCKPVYEPAPDPVVFKHLSLFFANFNLTDDQYGIEFRGLNGEIREFYVNELSDLVVLQVQFTNVRVNNSLDVFRYHRPGKVDAITKSSSRAVYPSFATTTVFRGVKHLDLKRAESTLYFDALPMIFISPSAGDHPDPGVRATFADFVARPRVVVQEIGLTAAPLVATNYVQYTICDYGLKTV